jgi:hypothetical protein
MKTPNLIPRLEKKKKPNSTLNLEVLKLRDPEESQMKE